MPRGTQLKQFIASLEAMGIGNIEATSARYEYCLCGKGTDIQIVTIWADETHDDQCEDPKGGPGSCARFCFDESGDFYGMVCEEMHCKCAEREYDAEEAAPGKAGN